MKRNKDGSLSLTDGEVCLWQNQQENKKLSQKQIEQSVEFLHGPVAKDPVYNISMQKYFLSRQHCWPEGNLMVEIAIGGIDHSSPDMLVEEFASLGEGYEFTSPIEAVESAIQIKEAWQKIKPNEEITIGYGHTMGGMFSIEPSTIEECQTWAERTYEKLPKCDECGELIQEEFTHDFGGSFCRSFCAEKNYLREVAHDEDPNYYSGN